MGCAYCDFFSLSFVFSFGVLGHESFTFINIVILTLKIHRFILYIIVVIVLLVVSQQGCFHPTGCGFSTVESYRSGAGHTNRYAHSTLSFAHFNRYWNQQHSLAFG